MSNFDRKRRENYLASFKGEQSFDYGMELYRTMKMMHSDPTMMAPAMVSALIILAILEFPDPLHFLEFCKQGIDANPIVEDLRPRAVPPLS